MLFFASLGGDQAIVLPYLSLAIGVCGLAGLVFAALKYRRDDSTAVSDQSANLVSSMKALNEETRLSEEKMRKERDELNGQVAYLTGQNDVLQRELQEYRAQVSGKMTRIEEKRRDA